MWWHNLPPAAMTSGLYTLALSFLTIYCTFCDCPQEPPYYLLWMLWRPACCTLLPALEIHLYCHYKGELATNHTHLVYPPFKSPFNIYWPTCTDFQDNWQLDNVVLLWAQAIPCMRTSQTSEAEKNEPERRLPSLSTLVQLHTQMLTKYPLMPPDMVTGFLWVLDTELHPLNGLSHFFE